MKIQQHARKAAALVLAAVATLAVATPPVIAADAGAYTIYMATWRGMTAAERGFVDYMKENRIPVDFVFRDAAEDKTRIPAMVAEIKRERPDLVYAFGTSLTLGLVGAVGAQDPARHITRIPVVFNIVADPLGAKLVESLDASGRNLTGASHLVPLATQVKAIQTLGEFKTIGALYNPLEANSRLTIEQMEAPLKAAGIELVKGPIPVVDGKPSLAGVPGVLRRLARAGAQLVYLPSDSFLIANAAEVVPMINARKLPSFSATEAPIREAGALIGLVSNYYTVGKFAGYKARQILEGKMPVGEVPIETLAKYTFVVNLETMRQLEFYPPVTVLQFAEVVGR